MTAYALCEDCIAGKHCYGANDEPMLQELIDLEFCGGFMCSCECARKEE
jgi:hypothetical protein